MKRVLIVPSMEQLAKECRPIADEEKVLTIKDSCKSKNVDTQEVNAPMGSRIVNEINTIAEEEDENRITRVNCATLTENGDDTESKSKCNYCHVRLANLRLLERRKARKLMHYCCYKYSFQSRGVYQNKSCQTSSGWYDKAEMTLEEERFLSILLRARKNRRNRPESFCKCVYQGKEEKCQCGEVDEDFDWVWHLVDGIRVTQVFDNNRLVIFHQDFSCGTGIIRGSQAMMDDQYFWEIKFTTPVYGTDMMVGFGSDAVDLRGQANSFCSLLGIDAESWGISYNGRIQHAGQKHNYCSRFGQGTIIGFHLDMWHGTVSLFKNRRPLGVAFSGLKGKTVYPMACSTAARSGMKILTARSFPSSLQFLCCRELRHCIPSHLNVLDAVTMPPGLKLYLANRLSWLFRPLCLEPKVNSYVKNACPICLPFTNVLEDLTDYVESDEDEQDDFHILGIPEHGDEISDEDEDEEISRSLSLAACPTEEAPRLQGPVDSTEDYPFSVKRARVDCGKTCFNRHHDHSCKSPGKDESYGQGEPSGVDKEDLLKNYQEQIVSRKRKK